MKTLYISIIALIGISINSMAQEKSRKEKEGDKYSFRYAFDKAINSYNHAKKLTPDGQRKLAESHQNLGQMVEAEIVYSKLITAGEGVIPMDYYNYAMILKTNSKYEEAGRQMDKFVTLMPNDLRGKSYSENKEKLGDLLKDDGKYKIENLKVNTDAQDFGTSYFKNKIVFTSTRATPKIIKRKYNWNGKPFLDMYVSELDGIQLKEPENFDKNLDSKFHDGPASFSNNGTYMAFTKNHSKDKSKDKVVELQIWFSSFVDKSWTEPVSFSHNNTAYQVGQPCLTADGKTMYFVCDMPGGFGGADIYRVTKGDKGEWGVPENLGNKINTEGDEVFPFVEEKNEILFFSSNGHFGLGELDIFMSAMNGKAFGHVNNAGTPLNTKYDDFAIITDSMAKLGYFSSNRAGGSGDDDIYSVDILKGLDIDKKIKGIAKDKDENPIANTFMTLLDDKNNIIDTVTTKDNAAYTFLAESGKDFKLIGKKEKYNDGTNVANTSGKEYVVKADVILLAKEEVIPPTKAEVVAQKIQEGADLGKIEELELNTIYFDYHKYNIRPDAEIELNKIVKIMNEYPNMVVKLNSHTDCRSTKNYNQKLSERRAIASSDYIKKRISKPERVSGKGYGETKLVSDCACEGKVVSTCSEEDHQKNRRTEFIVIKK